MEIWILAILFFVTAMGYAAAGFGGGSTYLALLALVSMPYLEMRTVALVCNCIVVGGGVFVFWKHIQWKSIFYFLLASIPLAFLGAQIAFPKETFTFILAVALLLAGLTMVVNAGRQSIQSQRPSSSLEKIAIGGVVGLVAGIVGIGGGVFLAPFLHFRNWTHAKSIAATTSVFILLNSCAGLLGIALQHSFSIEWGSAGILGLAVFFGGMIGSQLSLRWVSPKWFRVFTGALLLIVAFRLFFY